MWPLVLDFIETYVGKAELKAFKEHFDVKGVEQKDDVLVKAGGIQALLGSFFKQNKKAYKLFMKAKKAKTVVAKDDSESDKEEKVEAIAGKKRKRTDSSDAAPQKRKRAESNVSAKSVKSAKSKNDSEGPTTRSRGASMNADEEKKAPAPAPKGASG